MATLSSPTAGRLIVSVRNLLGQPNPTNSAWTDAELLEYLNEGVRVYFTECIAAAEGDFTKTTTLDYTASVETVALPADFFKIKALYIQRNNGWEILEYMNNVTSGFINTGGNGGSNTYSPSYYFMGNNIVLHPTPNFTSTGGQLRLDYIAFPDQMVSAVDTLGGTSIVNAVSPVFKQLIEAYAVYIAKLKQSMVNGTDLTALPKARLESLYTTFINSVSKKSIYPEYIVPFNPEG